MHRHRHWMDDDHLQFTSCVVSGVCQTANHPIWRGIASGSRRGRACPARDHVHLVRALSVHRAFWTARKRLAACECVPPVCASWLCFKDHGHGMAGLEREERATGRKCNGQGQPQPVATHRPASRKGRRKEQISSSRHQRRQHARSIEVK